MCKGLGSGGGWGADARGKEVQGLGGIRRVGGVQGVGGTRCLGVQLVRGGGGGVQGVWEYNWLGGGGYKGLGCVRGEEV